MAKFTPKSTRGIVNSKGTDKATRLTVHDGFEPWKMSIQAGRKQTGVKGTLAFLEALPSKIPAKVSASEGDKDSFLRVRDSASVVGTVAAEIVRNAEKNAKGGDGAEETSETSANRLNADATAAQPA